MGRTTGAGVAPVMMLIGILSFVLVELVGGAVGRG
jgi:hypothetical protein